MFTVSAKTVIWKQLVPTWSSWTSLPCCSHHAARRETISLYRLCSHGHCSPASPSTLETDSISFAHQSFTSASAGSGGRGGIFMLLQRSSVKGSNQCGESQRQEQRQSHHEEIWWWQWCGDDSGGMVMDNGNGVTMEAAAAMARLVMAMAPMRWRQRWNKPRQGQRNGPLTPCAPQWSALLPCTPLGLGTLTVADDGDDDKNGDNDGYSNKPGLVGMARVSESQFCLEGMQYANP